MRGIVRVSITDQPVRLEELADPDHLHNSAQVPLATDSPMLQIPEIPQTHGAEILFLGKIRNHNLGKSVRAVSYDAHPTLAQKVLREICEEAQGRWGNDLCLTVIHRIGRVEINEISVVIQVSSTHRNESYQASRYVIEQLKDRVPIWKKEHYLEGESEWLQGHALCSHSSDLHSSGPREPGL